MLYINTCCYKHQRLFSTKYTICRPTHLKGIIHYKIADSIYIRIPALEGILIASEPILTLEWSLVVSPDHRSGTPMVSECI
jgi:hypothetical protein